MKWKQGIIRIKCDNSCKVVSPDPEHSGYYFYSYIPLVSNQYCKMLGLVVSDDTTNLQLKKDLV